MSRIGMLFAGFMRGRYGNDNLNRTLMIVTLILIVINFIARSSILNFTVVMMLIYVYSRMLSRNISARMRENQAYLRFETAVRNKIRRRNGGGFSKGSVSFTSKADKTHKILRCPACGEKLRVPKGAGKINISCPHCRTKFTKKV